MVCASEAINASALHTNNFKIMTTNTETKNATRKLILVKTEEDAGKGSLREAIIKGNEAIERGEKVEIRFTKNMTIEASTSYQLTKGDWLINDLVAEKNDGICIGSNQVFCITHIQLQDHD